MPNPEPGTWTFQVDTGATWASALQNPNHRDDSDVAYTLTIRLLRADIRASPSPGGDAIVDLENTGSTLREPLLEGWPASLTSRRGDFLPTGLPNLFEISVPDHASALALYLRSEHGLGTEMYLYDCTTGQCFSYTFAMPTASSHTLLVRNPAAGRWIVAVNAAPFPARSDSFVLEQVVASGTAVRVESPSTRRLGAR